MHKILIIEDEAAYLKLLSDQFTANGYEVVTAKDGEKGLEMALKTTPDLILLDIRLPKIDGMAMLDLLRKDDKGKKMKVIVLTNLEPDDKILSEVVDTAPIRYFVKSDISLKDLLGKVKVVLGDKK